MLQCIGCNSTLPVCTEGDAECQICGEKYSFAENYVKTSFDQKLFDNYRKDYLLNKVLNNNGYISYQFLQEGSISLPDRADVAGFRRFLDSHSAGGVILDVGCGVMARPGYLDFDNAKYTKFIGLDPIDDKSFFGLRMVACSEYIPLASATVDTIVFATSMDHVCNLKKTVAESNRVLKMGGRVVVWMSDRSMSLAERCKGWLRRRINSWKKGYSVDKYYVYPNWTVLGVPPGGVDPFHSFFETPEKITKLFSKGGYKLVQLEAKSKMEVFLSFEKMQ